VSWKENSDPGQPVAVYRVAQVVLLSIALLGGGVLVRFWILGNRQASSHGITPPAGPAWLSSAPRKIGFSALVTPGKPEQGKPLLDRIASREGTFPSVSSAESKWNMTRTLSRGYEFDSQLDLTAQPHSSSQWVDMGLRVTRPGAEVVSYRAEVGEKGFGRLQYAAQPDKDKNSENDAYQDVTVDSDAPLAIGDLRARDVIDFIAALKAYKIQYLGTLDTYNSIQLQVFEVPLGEGREKGAALKTQALGKSEKVYQGNATSALLYCEPAGLAPRTIRFFDSGGRLVRTYSNFIFSSTKSGEFGDELRLTDFRVDSVPTDSNTTFHLEKSQLLKR
jgi:hypothetical protein